MIGSEFVKLIGTYDNDAEYVPFAALMRSGHACCGYYNARLNAGFEKTCVVLNAHLIELSSGDDNTRRASIENFGEFLEEIVHNYARSKTKENPRLLNKRYGRSIPLTAVSYEEFIVVYPVAHIESLMTRTQADGDEQGDGESKLPTFLDFEKSEILRLLRTKLW